MTVYRAILLLLVTSCTWLALSALAGEPPRIQFIRPPHFVSSQEPVRLQVRVEPHKDNRMLTLAIVEGEFIVVRHDEALDGEKAPRHKWFWVLVPPCDPCLLVGAVYGVSGKQLARTTTPIHVFSLGPAYASLP